MARKVVKKKPYGRSYSAKTRQTLRKKVGTLKKNEINYLKQRNLLDDRALITANRKLTSAEKAKLGNEGLFFLRKHAVGTKNLRAKPKGKAKPKGPSIPSIQRYLGIDADYQRAAGNLKTNWGTYKARNQGQRRNLVTDFDTTKRRLTEQQTKDRLANTYDSAARGMFGTGIQQNEVNKLNQAYSEQFDDSRVSYDRNLNQLRNDFSDAERLYTQQVADAKAEAIRRRAAKYGITK